jgi:hypothetical protein
MPAKMARSGTQPPFEVPGLRQSSAPPGALVRKRKKRKNPRRFGVHLENPGVMLLIDRNTPAKGAAMTDQVKAAATDPKVIAASFFALIYFLVLLFLLSQFGLGGWPWSKPLFTGDFDKTVSFFNALSALGTAAVGVLLGTKIEQVKVEAAKKDKEKAEGALQGLAAAAKDVLPAVGATTPRATFTDDDIRIASEKRDRLLQAIGRADTVLARG